MNAIMKDVIDDIEEVILEDELRRAVMIEHPLNLRQMTGRFQYVVSYRLSMARFSELFHSFVSAFEGRKGLIAGSWYSDPGGPSRALAWCGENGERVMMICDGSGKLDDSVIHLGFTNFEVLPELACMTWKPIQMKSDPGVNPWGIALADLIVVETHTPVRVVTPPAKKLGFWARLFG